MVNRNLRTSAEVERQLEKLLAGDKPAAASRSINADFS